MKPLLTLLILLFCTIQSCTDSTYSDVRKPENKELKIVAEGYSWQAYKVTVDSIDYIIVSKATSDGGIAIIKHGSIKP